MPGSLNDITVFHFSSLIPQIIKSEEIEFQVNNNKYKSFYLLCDGIYPNYSIFQGPIDNPINAKERLFNKKQSAIRKNVECAFGILKKKFEIIKKPCIKHDIDFMNNILYCISILHNMVIQFDNEEEDLDLDHVDNVDNIDNEDINNMQILKEKFLTKFDHILNKEINNQLRKDLIEHIWSHHGNE